jgi:NAD-dependent deacetylase
VSQAASGDPTGTDPPSPSPSPELEAARDAIRTGKGTVILTGAGVSAESGVPTFRDRDGLWARYDPQELATPEGFRRDPLKVWEWYDLRRKVILGCSPNPGHRAIARFLAARADATLVTQNVDGLHRRALEAEDIAMSSVTILELHGNLARTRCSGCTFRRWDPDPVGARDLDTLPRCPECEALLRPDVIWFGEMLDARTLETAFLRAREADVCVVAGTSALVHPAASVPLATLEGGGLLIEVNPQETPLTRAARWSLRGLSGHLLPLLLEA